MARHFSLDHSSCRRMVFVTRVVPGLLWVAGSLTRSTRRPLAVGILAHFHSSKDNNFNFHNNNIFGKRNSSSSRGSGNGRIVKGNDMSVTGSPALRDTIFAVSTGRGKAALSVIRISGPNSFQVLILFPFPTACLPAAFLK